MNLEIEIVEHLNKAGEFLKAANLCLNANLRKKRNSSVFLLIQPPAPFIKGDFSF
jgi:hypothetical protein